jgi:hypothetical protein
LPLLIAGLVLLSGAPAGAQDTAGVGAMQGRVVNGAGAPASDVAVCVASAGRCEVTDAAGRFRIGELRPDRYVIEVTAPGHPPIVSERIEVRAGLDAEVEVTLPAIEQLEKTVTVTAPAFAAPEEVKTSSFLVRGTDIDGAAGALQDVSRFVQALPGVVIGDDDFRNDIIVRGGSPLENLFVVDNVEIPNINSFANFASAGGTVSLVDSALVQDVTFLTGGYPAPFVNRTSSVLQIAQREGDRTRTGGRATVGFAGAGAVLEGPLGSARRGSWIVSARRSFLDLFTDDVGFGGVPVTYTLNGKALYDVSPRDRVWMVNVTGNDRVRLGATGEIEDPDEELNNVDIRYSGWRSATGVNWQRLFGSRGVGLLGVSHSVAQLTSQVKDLIRNGIPPADAPVDDVIANGAVVFTDDSRESETTVKYDFTAYVPFLDKIQAGGTVKLFHVQYDASQPFGYNSPYSVEPDINPFDLDQDYTTSQFGAYVQGTENLTSRLNLTWGLRVDRYSYLGQTRLSPRAGMSYRLADAWSWRASYGRYYQQPFSLFLSAFPENRSLVPFSADHYVTGLTWTPGDASRVTLEAYYKDYRDYPVAAQFPSVSLANVGDTFNVQDVLFPLVSEGRGRSTGIELFAERRFTDRWYGQANVAASRTRHAGRDGLLRPGSFDYPVVLNALGGYKLSPRWTASSRISWLAGRPYTPFDAVLSSEAGRGIYDLSRVNADRAAAYFRFDVRLDRTFTVGGRPVTVFAGVQNLTNRRNFAGYQWSRRTNRLVFQEQLGVFPVLGLDWRF